MIEDWNSLLISTPVSTRLQTPVWRTLVWMEALVSTVKQQAVFACRVMEETCVRQVRCPLSDKKTLKTFQLILQSFLNVLHPSPSILPQTWRSVSQAGTSFRDSVIITSPSAWVGRRLSSSVGFVAGIWFLSWPLKSRTTSTVKQNSLGSMFW